MTDESKTKRDTDELVLDWDDALDSWEQDIDKAAEAESAPFPQGVEPPSKSPASEEAPAPSESKAVAHEAKETPASTQAALTSQARNPADAPGALPPPPPAFRPARPPGADARPKAPPVPPPRPLAGGALPPLRVPNVGGSSPGKLPAPAFTPARPRPSLDVPDALPRVPGRPRANAAPLSPEPSQARTEDKPQARTGLSANDSRVTSVPAGPPTADTDLPAADSRVTSVPAGPPSADTEPPANDSRVTSVPPGPPEKPRGSTTEDSVARPQRMYRPPNEAELRELEAIGTRTLPPPPGGVPFSWLDDDNEVESTRIAAIPPELMEKLSRMAVREQDASHGDTVRPPEPLDLALLEEYPLGKSEHDAAPADLEGASQEDPFGDEVTTDLPSLPATGLRRSVSTADNPVEPGAFAPRTNTLRAPLESDADALDAEPTDVNLERAPLERLTRPDSDHEATTVATLSATLAEAAEFDPALMRESERTRSDDDDEPMLVVEQTALDDDLDFDPDEIEAVISDSLRPAPPEPESAPPSGEAAEGAEVSTVWATRSSERSLSGRSGTISLEDKGALAALRTIRSRRRHVEQLPLASADAVGKRARLGLLLALSERRPPAQAAELLIAAAELAESLEDVEQAKRLYQQALERAPHLSIAQRALARLELAHGGPDAYLKALEARLAQVNAPGDRARLLATVARVRWLVERDLAGALRAATEAVQLAPDEARHRLLLARIENATQAPSAAQTLTHLAEHTQDGAMAALWFTSAGRVHDVRAETQQAEACYARAQAHAPRDFEANLALARLRLLAADRAGAAEALLNPLADLTGGPLTEALRRRAASLLGRSADTAAQALALLRDDNDPASVRTAFDVAFTFGDRDAREHVLRTWIAASMGPERALAYVMLSELRAEAKDFAESERALSSAAESDPNLGLTSAMREWLMKRYGASFQSTELSDTGLEQAAKLAYDREAAPAELGALLRARADQVTPRCTEVLILDAALEARDEEVVAQSLREQASQGALEERISTLLCLADVLRRRGDVEGARAALREANGLDAGHVMVSRALLRAGLPADERVPLLKREADRAGGARAACLLLRAAHLLTDDDQARLDILAAAYEVAPNYAPAMWALHQEARRQNDITRLSDLHAREAGRAKDAHEAVAHLVRAALVRAGTDADAAAAQLTRALDLMPSDPVVRELVIRLGDAVPATLRAEAIQSSAERATEPLRRAAMLSAASAFEDANQPARAAALYAAVQQEHPQDPIAAMGMERVGRAAGQATQQAEQRRRAAEEAQTPAQRIRALEALLELDEQAGEERVQVARALLEHAPTHARALRVLERHAMETNDTHALFEVQLRMFERSRGPKDRLSRLRLISALLLKRAPERESSALFDDLVSRTAAGLDTSLWLGRHLMNVGAARGDAAQLKAATELLRGVFKDPTEQAALAVQQAQLLMATTPSEAAGVLCTSLPLAPHHPTLLEGLAEAELATSDAKQAAERFVEAAQQASLPQRRARLYYRAGRLQEESLKAPDRARDAYRKAADADVGYADVQERLEKLLSGRNDTEALIALNETRLKAAESAEARVEIQRRLAALYEKRGDAEQALTALRNAVDEAPEDPALLSDFAGLLSREQQHRECAEVLVRLARISRAPEQLTDTFFRLGELYDLHLPDARRAEVAYRRVLKLSPNHPKALERLAELHKRSGQVDLAAESLELLIQTQDSTVRKREISFDLAKLKEDAGEVREAEEVLERLRKLAPTDLQVLRGLAEFYRRTSPQTALVMHLNRAVNDLRHALSSDPDDAALWSGLVEFLTERGRTDAAATCASAAYALGLADAKLAAYTKQGDVPGFAHAAFSELLDDVLFPDNLPPSVRILFRHGAEALNRVVPLDLRALAAEKIERRHPLRAVALEMAKSAGLGDVDVYVTAQLPCAFVPVSDSPLVLLVGRSLLDTLKPAEQAFLVARACKIARAQMSITCRVRPDEVGMLLGGLIRVMVPDYTMGEGTDATMLEEVSRRVGKHLSRRAREELLPHAVELAGLEDFDGVRAYVLASTAGNRAALVATGSVQAGLSALFKLAGLPSEARLSPSAIAQVEEARDLLTFAISEAHFEARGRAGAERR